tara:strand:- start:29 stop:223 length:195 start_codon:yes stop_codon:yes gene_type:complete
MNISKKNHKKLYNSIYEPIMDLRVKINMNMKADTANAIDIDLELFKLASEIDKRIAISLNLTRT